MGRPRKPLNDSPARWRSISVRFGLSREQFLRILEDQGGTCFICKRSPFDIRPKQHLAIDHNHTSGAIRGLLCFNCNRNVLTYFEKDPSRATRLYEYLTRTTSYGTVPA